MKVVVRSLTTKKVAKGLNFSILSNSFRKLAPKFLVGNIRHLEFCAMSAKAAKASIVLSDKQIEYTYFNSV